MISGLYVGGSGGGGGANKYEIKLVASNVTGVTDGSVSVINECNKDTLIENKVIEVR